MTPTEKKILDAIDQPMTRREIEKKLGYKPDSINGAIKSLIDSGCIAYVGTENKKKLYDVTGKVPNENKTLGFTIFGVRI